MLELNYDKVSCLMLDLDGVMADYTTAFLAVAAELFPDRQFDQNDITKYNFWDDGSGVDISEDEFFEIFNRVLYRDIKETSDFEAISEFLTREDDDGEYVVEYVKVVTARPVWATAGTIRWLVEKDVRYDELVFCRTLDKVKYCGDVTHVLDDRQEIVDEIKQAYPSTTIIPVPRCWNSM